MCTLFGGRISSERRRMGLGQQTFGEKCGVKKGAQINYEASKRAPDLRYLINADEIGVDVHFIVTGERNLSDDEITSVYMLIENFLHKRDIKIETPTKARIFSALLDMKRAREAESFLKDSDLVPLLKAIGTI
jgi:transcriptional regulator with XRE-family HTH domain